MSSISTLFSYVIIVYEYISHYNNNMLNACEEIFINLLYDILIEFYFAVCAQNAILCVWWISLNWNSEFSFIGFGFHIRVDMCVNK